jgi:hypothetical protein
MYASSNKHVCMHVANLRGSIIFANDENPSIYQHDSMHIYRESLILVADSLQALHETNISELFEI